MRFLFRFFVLSPVSLSGCVCLSVGRSVCLSVFVWPFCSAVVLFSFLSRRAGLTYGYVPSSFLTGQKCSVFDKTVAFLNWSKMSARNEVKEKKRLSRSEWWGGLRVRVRVRVRVKG